MLRNFLVLCLLLSIGTPTLSRAAGPTELERYLTHELDIREPEDFLLSKQKRKEIEAGFHPDKPFDDLGQLTPEAKKAVLRTFSPVSGPNLVKLAVAMGRERYSNAQFIGEAGSGKSFTIDQMVTMFTFGVVPEFLEVPLGLRENESDFLKQLREAFFNKTQFLTINHSLLSHDNTKSGKAFAKSEIRMRAILVDLFNAAKKDFQTRGLRTIFIMEEVATLPELVQQTLKTLHDRSGFKTTSASKIEKGAEVGYSAIGITTHGEYRDMLRADSAVERRYEKVFQLEPSEEQALGILRIKRDSLIERYALVMEDEVLVYLLSMKSFFANPPLAMPDSVLQVLDGLFLWATKHPDLRKHGDELTIDEAYHYLVEANHLPRAAWLPDADGRPPLWDLESQVKKLVVDQDAAVHHIVQSIKTGRATGFREVPVFIIMGPSGSGKNTIAKAINLVMFGHEGHHLKFDLSHSTESRMRSILEVSGDENLPLLAMASEDGPPNGAVVFDEAKDLPSGGFDQLKTVVEEGLIRPTGLDKRVRPLGLKPIFIMGQWGEELFKGKSDDEVREIVARTSRQTLERILSDGADGGRKGAVPHALIQRALRTGGIFLLPPVRKSQFIKIVENNAAGVIANLKARSNLTVEVSPAVLKFVAQAAADQNMTPRELDRTLKDLTEKAISEAYDQKMPMRGISIRISLAEANTKLVVSHLDGDGKPVNEYAFAVESLVGTYCSALLAPSKNETGQE